MHDQRYVRVKQEAEGDRTPGTHATSSNLTSRAAPAPAAGAAVHGPIHSPYAAADPAAAAAAPTSDATAAASVSSRPPSRALLAVYFLLGAGVLSAWNALITATDYFGLVYPGWHTDRLFTIAYFPTCLGALALVIRYPALMSPHARVRWGFVGFTVTMLAVPLVDALLVPTYHPSGSEAAVGAGEVPAPAPGTGPAAALAAVLLCVALVGACDGLCQGALFGEAGQQHPEVLHAVVSGTASSGLLVCVLRIVSKAAMAGDGADREALRNGTRMYFAIAGLMSAGSLVLYDFVLPRICPPAVLHGLYDPKAAAAHHKALSEHSQDSRSGGRGHGAGGAVSEHQPLLLEVQLSGDLSAGEDTRHSGTCYSDTCHVGATAGTPGTSGPEGVGERGLQRSLEGARGSSGSLGIGAHGGEAAAGSCRSRSPGVSGHGRDEARALLLPAGGAAPTLPVSVTVPAPEAGPGTGVLRRSGALGALGGGGDAAGRGGLGVSAGCSGEGAAAAGGGTEGVGAVGYGEEEEEDVPPPRLWRCIALCWPLCGCLFATYVATLSIFPGFLAEDIHSAELGDWYAILLITAFNAADLAGKSLPRLTPLEEQQRQQQKGRAQHNTEGPGQGKGVRRAQGGPSSLSNGHCDEEEGGEWQQLAPTAVERHGLLHNSSSGTDTGGRMASRGGLCSRGEGGAAADMRGQCWGWVAALCGAPLRPLRSPGGLLAASVARGLVMVPGFLLSARLGAPAFVMGLLTLALGLSNGYLTAQAMTMGPSTTAHCGEEHVPALHGPGQGPTNGSGGTRGSADTCQARVRHRLELERHAHAELVEHLLVFSLVGGLNAGAVLGWLWLL